MQNQNTRRGFTQQIQVGQELSSSSPLVGEVARSAEGGLFNRKNFFNTLLPRLTAVLPPQGREITAGGFTLIELLVVVLIIGILAAVALPQYNKAVKKAQMAEVYNAVDALDKALGAYYAENGTYRTLVDRGDGYSAIHAEDLSFEIPKLNHFKYQRGIERLYEFQIGSLSTEFGLEAGQGLVQTIVSDTDPEVLFYVGWEKGLLKDKRWSPLEDCKFWVNCTEVQVGTDTICYF